MFCTADTGTGTDTVRVQQRHTLVFATGLPKRIDSTMCFATCEIDAVRSDMWLRRKLQVAGGKQFVLAHRLSHRSHTTVSTIHERDNWWDRVPLRCPAGARSCAVRARHDHHEVHADRLP